MSFAWLDSLALAAALLQARPTLAPEEACCRAAISRAYDAVYGAARPLHRAIGDSLRQLRSARHRADYDDQLDRPVALAAFAGRRAQQVVTQLQALAPPPPAPTDVSAPASPETTEER